MAKQFACRDIGMECEFTARAETDEELMSQIKEHAKTAHNMAKIDAKTMKRMKAAIKSV